MSKICSKCKAENNDNARICGNCGIVLINNNLEQLKEEQEKVPDVEVIEEINQTDESIEKEEDNGSRYVAILLFIFVLTAISFFILPSATIMLIFVFAVATVVGMIMYPKNKDIRNIFLALLFLGIAYVVFLIIFVKSCISCITQIDFIIR